MQESIMMRQIPRADWATEFQAITKRNSGRPTVVEEYDQEMGPLEVENDYPLLGISYDRRDDRIDIMLGNLADPKRHLMHSIGNVLFVELVTDPAGIDQSLRILRRDGAETVLGFRHAPSCIM
jgi:hypothetical protein